MIKEYLVIYLNTFIRGLVFLLFGMKAWSIYTCNTDYFEKKFNHVSNFNDIFNANWGSNEKISVCDEDTNLDGLGFLKNGFIYSINWVDYWTKRWICYFLKYGLEPFCCDDPKKKCESGSNILNLQLGKNTQIIFSGLVNLIKIVIYGFLNILFLLPILLGISLLGGFNGAYKCTDDFNTVGYNSFDKLLKSIPQAPWLFQSLGAIFSSYCRLIEPVFRGIYLLFYFFFIWGLLFIFNYAKTFIFMLSGDGCGCGIFSKWKVQNNKVILTRMLIPILIWASFLFSKFILYQIFILRNMKSPQIMPNNMFQASLNYYFMKYDIDKLKYKNTNKEEIDIWYNNITANNYENNLKELKEDKNILNKNDTSSNLEELPSVLAALKLDLKEKNNLITLSNKFKNNQTVLSNMLEHIYGNKLEIAVEKLKYFSKVKKKIRDLTISSETTKPIPNYDWYGEMDTTIKGNIAKNMPLGTFTPMLIELKLQVDLMEAKNNDNSLKNKYKKLIKKSTDTQYFQNLAKFTNKNPQIYNTESITKQCDSIEAISGSDMWGTPCWTPE